MYPDAKLERELAGTVQILMHQKYCHSFKKFLNKGKYREGTQACFKLWDKPSNVSQPLGDHRLDVDDSHVAHDVKPYRIELDLDTTTVKLIYSVEDVVFIGGHYPSNPREVSELSNNSMDSSNKRGYAWAISAGANAALAAIAAKFFSSQFVKYGFIIVFNVMMWGCYVNSLKALSSLQATVTHFATNFLSSGLAGFFLFDETISTKIPCILSMDPPSAKMMPCRKHNRKKQGENVNEIIEMEPKADDHQSQPPNASEHGKHKTRHVTNAFDVA
ncbi:hypothetical protein IFM89_007943 [Coptis chinensis]|uniref:Uncharacterized protein n=1 Tax=Coptis chinensis TaxID=261450 RepID=A0A835INU1_9MAGN|nr:hypothetical protein IFM89_007943 [Coptis chinensis]